MSLVADNGTLRHCLPITKSPDLLPNADGATLFRSTIDRAHSQNTLLSGQKQVSRQSQIDTGWQETASVHRLIFII
jgi:hypothetical protein